MREGVRRRRRARWFALVAAALLPVWGAWSWRRPAPPGAGPGLATAASVARAQTVELRWGFPAAINDDASGSGQSDPALAVDAAGAVHAVWADGRLGGAGGAIYYARLAPGATRWAANMRVAGGDDGVERGDPALAIDALGSAHVVWVEGRGGDPDLMHSALVVGSRAWSSPLPVSDRRTGVAELSPVVAADPFANVHVLWADDRAGDLDVYHARRFPGGGWSASQRVNNPPSGDQRAPAVVATKSGDLFAAWEDTRHGRADVFASRLPPGGDVWWPNGQLSRGEGGGMQRGPSLASDSTGRVMAVWVDESAGALRATTLPDPGGAWAADRVVFRPPRGAPLAVSAAGGPGGQTIVVWSESRPGDARVYGGRLPAEGEIVPSRVDVNPLFNQAGPPVAAVDAQARAHAVWQSRDRQGQIDIVHGQVALDPPRYPATSSSGWLHYRPRQFNCATDGFATVQCDGTPDQFIVSRGVDLVPFLGSYVTVAGQIVVDAACPYILATGVTFRLPPCPRASSAVTGILTDGGQPVEWASVHVGDTDVPTGPSGRFFVDGLAPGATYTVTATLECALTVSTGPLRAAGGLNVLPTGAFTRGDVNEDCAIDIVDLVRVAAQFKSTGPFFPPCSDVDGDGAIGIYDLATIAANYGRTCPAPWQPAAAAAGAVHQARATPPPRAPARTR